MLLPRVVSDVQKSSRRITRMRRLSLPEPLQNGLIFFLHTYSKFARTFFSKGSKSDFELRREAFRRVRLVGIVLMTPQVQALSDRFAPLCSGQLPLLLLPGTACDARLFRPLLAELGDIEAIIGDMSSARTMPMLAQNILAQAPPRFALLGFSLGGIAALEIIAQQPERVERLCLVDTTPRPDGEANAAIRRAAVAKARADGMNHFILEAWPNLVSPSNRGDGRLRDIICAMARDTGADVLANQSEAAIHRADSRPRLGAIAVPTLILAGEHERVCPLEAHREMADGIPGADYRLVPTAGHFAPLENPVAVATHVRRWLDAVPTTLHATQP
jgi:pimeloyl-ACP methyl ester carboxylesterase